eukprot:scaffold30832_cov67-Phaeocystis_antarctica.AAC.14
MSTAAAARSISLAAAEAAPGDIPLKARHTACCLHVGLSRLRLERSPNDAGRNSTIGSGPAAAITPRRANTSRANNATRSALLRVLLVSMPAPSRAR